MGEEEEEDKKEKVPHTSGQAYTKSWFWRIYLKERCWLSAHSRPLLSLVHPHKPLPIMVFENLSLLWTPLASSMFSCLVSILFSSWMKRKRAHQPMQLCGRWCPRCSLLSKSSPGSAADPDTLTQALRPSAARHSRVRFRRAMPGSTPASLWGHGWSFKSHS